MVTKEQLVARRKQILEKIQQRRIDYSRRVTEKRRATVPVNIFDPIPNPIPTPPQKEKYPRITGYGPRYYEKIPGLTPNHGAPCTTSGGQQGTYNKYTDKCDSEIGRAFCTAIRTKPLVCPPGQREVPDNCLGHCEPIPERDGQPCTTSRGDTGTIFRNICQAINPTMERISIRDIERLRTLQSEQTVKAGKGFHGYVKKPTRFLVGESGMERVDITPIKRKKKEMFGFGFDDFDFGGGMF